MTERRASSSKITADRFELDRLAEELEQREGPGGTHHQRGSLTQTSTTSFDLPQLSPLTRDNAHLSAQSFDVEDFLLSRSYTSLPELRSELRGYLATLKEELVRLINDDYEAFISLSTDLRGEGARMERLKWPLEDLRSRIMVSHAERSW